MVSTRQNTQDNLMRLAAQRILYDDVRRMQLMRAIVTVVIPVFASLSRILLNVPSIYRVVGWKPETWMLPVLGVFMVAIDQFLLSNRLESNQQLASAIQEQFDCDVLRMPWNHVICGRPPTKEDIVGYARRINSADDSKLRNWYATPHEANLPHAVLAALCQRSNISWDQSQRRYYINRTIVTGTVTAGLLVIIAVIQNSTVRTFMSVVSGMLPVTLFLRNEVVNNQRAVLRLTAMRDTVETILDLLMQTQFDTERIQTISRQLQDLIYYHRGQAPVLPKWVYAYGRTRAESKMAVTAEALAQEYLTKATISAP